MNTECQRCADVNAFLAGEMSPREEEAFSAHLLTCSACAAAAESSRRLLTRLRAVPAAGPADDLAPRILSQIHAPRKVRRHVLPQWLGAAAALFTVLGCAWFMRPASPRKPAVAAPVAVTPAPDTGTVARALDWFVRIQEADGSWDAERWGGQRNYAPALTALPLLALVTIDETSPARLTAISRATASLLSLQNADGTFGRNFQGSPYNTSIATLALLHEWQRDPAEVPKPALDAAIASVIEHQHEGGGWGYRSSTLSDRSITYWHVQALELASRLGWQETGAALKLGVGWLAAHPGSEDEAGEPADSTSALLAHATARSGITRESPDFYQSYFSAAALRHAHDPSALARLDGIRHEIMRHQSTEGIESGSWPPDDLWGRAGGRLYSTALASLTLTDRQVASPRITSERDAPRSSPRNGGRSETTPPG